MTQPLTYGQKQAVEREWAAKNRTALECTGKDKLTQALAREVAKRQRSKDRRVDSYRCPSCGHWHVGGKPALVKGKPNRPPRWMQRMKDGE